MMHHGRRFFRRLKFDALCSDDAPPLKFFRDLRRQVAPRGEARLALAVLEDAVGCLTGSQDPWRIPQRLFRWEAEHWIRSRDRKSSFSFENICSFLQLDSQEMRERIRRWRAQGREESIQPFVASASERAF